MNSSDSNGSSTNSSILVRVRRQDPQAWSQLVDLYGPLVARWCRRRGLDGHSAADVVQDVLAAVSRSISTYDAAAPDATFRGWLWTITRNKLIDHRRREDREELPRGGSTALRQLAEIASDVDAVGDEEPTTSNDIHRLLRRAISQLEGSFTEQTWRAFWRTAIDGLSTAAAAEELEMTPAAVRQARSRILRRLRQQMGDLVSASGRWSTANSQKRPGD